MHDMDAITAKARAEGAVMIWGARDLDRAT